MKTKARKKECCKNSKNWRSYALISDSNGEPYVTYKCDKCRVVHGMNYARYLSRLRKDNPN